MEESGVSGLRFERVPERMTEIQNAAQTRFLFVRRNDFRFDPHRFGDQPVHNFGSLREYLVAMFGEGAEQRGIGNHTGFDHLIESGVIFARGSVASTAGSISTASG